MAFVACRRMNAATISTRPDFAIAWSSSRRRGRCEVSSIRAADCWASIAAVVAILRTATAAIATRIAWLPNQPMIAVASGGPATQATETMARVFTMSDGLAPECRRWAKSSEVPTPAGPPRTTRPITATGSDVVSATARPGPGSVPRTPT